MKLVLDANIVFSAMIAKGRKLKSTKIDLLFSGKLEFFAPTLLLLELLNNKEEIKSKSTFSDTDFNNFVEMLKLRVKFIPLKYLSDELKEAKEICNELKDIAYFALAIKLNCPIWSGEKSFKEQSRIEVLNTKELIRSYFNSL